jgi:cell division protein FtsW
VTIERERHAPDQTLLVSVVALTAIGILMVYSASGIRAYVTRADGFADVGPQLIWALLGVVAMVVAMRIDYRFWRLVSLPLRRRGRLVTCRAGARHRHRHRRLGPLDRLGPMPAIHPAEFAKLALIVYLAHWMASRGAGSTTSPQAPCRSCSSPDRSSCSCSRSPTWARPASLTMTAFTIFFVAGANLWQFLLLIPAGVAAVGYVILSHPYQLSRVTTFLDPWSDAQGKGFHTIQGLFALALGGLVGEGLGQSRSAGGLYLPNAANDFIFAVIGEEFGLLGGLIVIALFILVAYRGIRIALGAPDTFGGLMAVGITAWLAFQAFINIAVVVNLMPITGITLPFVSDGGSSLIVSFAAVGILLSISRETHVRGTWNDADPHRRRWFRRSHPAGPGGRPVATRAASGR